MVTLLRCQITDVSWKINLSFSGLSCLAWHLTILRVVKCACHWVLIDENHGNLRFIFKAVPCIELDQTLLHLAGGPTFFKNVWEAKMREQKSPGFYVPVLGFLIWRSHVTAMIQSTTSTFRQTQSIISASSFRMKGPVNLCVWRRWIQRLTVSHYPQPV